MEFRPLTKPYDPNSTTAPLLGKSGRLERLSLPLLTGACRASSFPRMVRSGLSRQYEVAHRNAANAQFVYDVT